MREAFAASDFDRLTTEIGFLRNTLLRFPAYREALLRVQPPIELVGAPVARFLKLAPPRSTPAPPDDSLAFAAQALPEAGGAWSLIRVGSLTGDGPPAVHDAGQQG